MNRSLWLWRTLFACELTLLSCAVLAVAAIPANPATVHVTVDQFGEIATVQVHHVKKELDR